VVCLGTDTLLAIAADRSPDRLARFESHVDDCADCRQLLGELAELSWMRVARTHDDAITEPTRAVLATGRMIDRYIIVDVIGAGGMGVVYSAYDPRLDRKIAVKVLRADRSGDHRLLAEATTLARLRHPNVVTVYDAGTFEDQVFIAMELVEGTTLREWLAARPRDWRDIVRVFVQAGRGLLAAHAAGIVHRDFKPDNVLVSERGPASAMMIGDERAQVADFGLARSGESGAAEIAGTPAYMSPEQRAGGVITAKSDQYSFCVALREALRHRRAPARIMAAVQRGAHESAARRFASMDELLRALRPSSRIVPTIAIASLAASIGFAAVAITRPAHGQAPPCGDPHDKLAGVWDNSTRELLRVRFAASGGAATFAAIEKRLDEYTTSWSAERGDACQATRVRGEQSQALLDQRVGCLDQRLGELATRIHILHEVSPATLPNVPHLFDSLPEPTACRSRSVLAHAAPTPPAGEVSTFDDGTMTSRFGIGWSVSTDRIMGGASMAQLAIADRALRITGTIAQARGPIAWAGAMFYPGKGDMAPADLSAFHHIAFSARGDGGTYEVLLFSQSKGDLPAFQLFGAGPTWKQYRFAIADFDGVNSGDIKGLLFASNRPGTFALEIDNVRFE